MTNFVNGDVVRLKSGGPLMTVTDDTYSHLVCSWFIDGKEFNGKYPSEALYSKVELDQMEAQAAEDRKALFAKLGKEMA